MAPTDIDTVLQEISEMKSFLGQRVEEGIAPTIEEMGRIKTDLTGALDRLRAIELERASRTDDGRVRVPTGRFAGWDFLDLKIAEHIIRRRVEAEDLNGNPELLRAIQEERRNLKSYVNYDTILAWEDGARQKMMAAFSGTQPLALRSFNDKLVAWRTAMVDEYTKAMDSTTAGSGDELVPTLEASALWMDVNLDTLVLPALPQVPMPSNPYDIPSQLGDVNWYPIVENVQGLTTDPTTAKTTLTAQGLRAGVPFSDELEEDAIIAFVPELRRNLARNGAEVIDDVLLNADQTATNGINSDGATISTSTAGKAQWLLGFDGLVHLPLVDNTSQASDINTTVSANGTYNAALRKLGKYASGRRPGEVVFISDVNTAIATLALDEVETIDKIGPRATISTGEVTQIYGVPLIRSEQLKLGDDDGKVTDSGNATDLGRVLAVNTSQWRVGFRRQITMETQREAGKGQTTMYLTFRIALAERTGTRSTATHTSLIYGVTSVT